MKTFLLFLVFALGIWADSLEEEIFNFAKEVRKEVHEATKISDSEELENGKKLANQMKREFRELQNSSSEYLQAIGNKVANYRKRKNIPIQFHLIDSEELNAFATAGGHVWVTTEILKFVRSDDELAGVLGHEIVHIDLEHCKKLIQVYVYTLKMTGDEDFSELANIVSLILNQPFSQEQELEADSTGAEFAYQAGYDAQRFMEFFDRLERKYPTDTQRKSIDKIVDKFFFTHPMNKERIAKLKTKMEELKSKYQSFQFWRKLEVFINKKFLFGVLVLASIALIYYFNFRNKEK